MQNFAGNSALPPTETLEVAREPSAIRAWKDAFREEGLTLHPMTLEDVADVAALERRCFPDPWSADSFLAEVERKPEIGHSLVLRDPAGDLAAYAVVWFIVDEIHIGNIAVSPDLRGRGLGRRLLEHILAEGRARSMAFATLEVRPSNRPAVSLYRSLGFRKVAVRKNYYHNDREDAHVLALTLDVPAGARA